MSDYWSTKNKRLFEQTLDSLLMIAKSGKMTDADKLQLQQMLSGQWKPKKLFLIQGGKS